MADQQLDQEFHCNLHRLDEIIRKCNYREKIIATEWISKLRATSNSTDERKLRNMFLEHFIKCCDGTLFSKPPFNKNLLVSAKLVDYAYYLPQLAKLGKVEKTSSPWEVTMKSVSEMFTISAEFSDFLSYMPVPRDGAIFIMNIKRKCN
ncbi:uncharacterized protein LOC119673373 [Teleopsis dalmanni]|uniref:uncharacterized protein LOC119673373 n=1 Tax=Teleopsis dalmanni TaxID=139649 RepID=UPI0018CD50C8|nr:uncharacterized protein LOC119673373 [Teleopsis dalmanni]